VCKFLGGRSSPVTGIHLWRVRIFACEATWTDLAAALRSPSIGLMKLAASVEGTFMGL